MTHFICRRRLKSAQLGVAAGIVYGFYMSLTSLLHLLFPSYAKGLVALWRELYPGYEPTFWRSLLLWPWGALEAFFALWLVGNLYNRLTGYGYGVADPGRSGRRSQSATADLPE